MMAGRKTFNLTLVRHGQTTHNKLKIIQGQMETQLTDLGRDQAKLLCNYLRETKERFDKVYASDLIRAYETCQLICDGQYNIIKNQLLRERSFGKLQGSSLDTLRQAAYDAGYNDSNYIEFRPENGETLDEVLQRVRAFSEDELFPRSEANSSILIVTHGGIIRSFMKFFMGLNCDLKSKDTIITPNTGINRFRITLDADGRPTEVRVIELHAIPHLKDEAKSEALREEQLNVSDAKEKEPEHAI